MRTNELHRSQPTLTEFEANIVDFHLLDDGTTAIELDRTAFYARSGGQAGDQGLIMIGVDELAVVDTRYSADRDAVLHYLAPGNTVRPATGAEVSGRIAADRRLQLTTGHTAQHLAYLATVMAVGPRPATGGTIDIDNVRVDVAHAAAEGTIDAQAVTDAYRALVDADLEIRRWADTAHAGLWWWEIEGHEPIGCGGTHLSHTGGAGNLEPSIKRKGSKHAVIKLLAASGSG